MITLDTSAVFALLNRADVSHTKAKAALFSSRPPFIVPAFILAEIMYLLEARAPHAAVGFLADLDSGAFTVDCGEADLGRIRQLVERYSDMSLGFADAAVIACAERSGGKVLSFDLRHFGVVAQEGAIVLLPDG